MGQLVQFLTKARLTALESCENSLEAEVANPTLEAAKRACTGVQRLASSEQADRVSGCPETRGPSPSLQLRAQMSCSLSLALTSHI